MLSAPRSGGRGSSGGARCWFVRFFRLDAHRQRSAGRGACGVTMTRACGGVVVVQPAAVMMRQPTTQCAETLPPEQRFIVDECAAVVHLSTAALRCNGART